MGKKRSRKSASSRRKQRPRATNGRERPDEAWDRFSKEHSGHPALQHEAIYSMPLKLIELIHRHVPDVFTEADLAFELDLTAATPWGFFQQRRFSYLLLGRSDVPTNDELDKSARKATSSIRQMLEEDMLSRRVSKADAIEVFSSADRERQNVDKQRCAFAAWLITNRDFRRQLNDLRRQHESEHPLDLPPRISLSVAPRNDIELDDRWSRFYHNWNIEGFATWELPIPMRPDLSTPSGYPTAEMLNAGILLFVPWFMLRDRDIRLYDIAERQQQLLLDGPLRDWVEATDKKWGPQRYNIMLRLYVYLELCLKRRYGDQIRRKAGRLDEVFAEYLRESSEEAERMQEESIRKIRQEMTKRLKD